MYRYTLRQSNLDEKERLKQVIIDLIHCFPNKDAEKWFSYLREDAFSLSTGQKEIAKTPSEHKAMIDVSIQFDDAKIRNYEIVNLKISGNVAWATVLIDFTITVHSITQQLPSRLSLVFEKTDGNWLISQWHASVPQIGIEETIGYSSKNDIIQKISELIEEVGINPDQFDNKAQLRKYLIEAKSLLEEDVAIED